MIKKQIAKSQPCCLYIGSTFIVVSPATPKMITSPGGKSLRDHVWIDGWMDEWMGSWMNGWIDR